MEGLHTREAGITGHCVEGNPPCGKEALGFQPSCGVECLRRRPTLAMRMYICYANLCKLVAMAIAKVNAMFSSCSKKRKLFCWPKHVLFDKFVSLSIVLSVM